MNDHTWECNFQKLEQFHDKHNASESFVIHFSVSFMAIHFSQQMCSRACVHWHRAAAFCMIVQRSHVIGHGNVKLIARICQPSKLTSSNQLISSSACPPRGLPRRPQMPMSHLEAEDTHLNKSCLPCNSHLFCDRLEHRLSMKTNFLQVLNQNMLVFEKKTPPQEQKKRHSQGIILVLKSFPCIQG